MDRADGPARRNRPHGTGSVMFHKGNWRGSISLGGRRYYVTANTTQAVEEKLLRLRLQWLESRTLPAPRPPKKRPHPFAAKPLTAEQVIHKAIDDAFRLDWDRATFVAVLLASLTPSRRQAGIYGPCFYCGDVTANTVDHLMPRVRGGQDNKGNLVSACKPCNSRKNDRTPQEFYALLARDGGTAA